jgi:hypothetical protein
LRENIQQGDFVNTKKDCDHYSALNHRSLFPITFIHIGLHRLPTSSVTYHDSIGAFTLARGDTQQALDAITMEKAHTFLLNDRLKLDRYYRLHQQDSGTVMRPSASRSIGLNIKVTSLAQLISRRS